MSGTVRVIDLPDLGAVTDAASIVADKTGTGRFSALAMKNYCATTTLPEAPSNNVNYGRLNGAWSPVVPDAPSNSVTYGRYNATWAATVPEAPLTGTTYGRVNGTWSGVLPITGGSISGNLSTSGTITSGSTVSANQFQLSSANGYIWQFLVQGGTGNQIEYHAPGWYEMWEVSTGAFKWASPANYIMTLDGTGNLFPLGYVNAPAFWVGSPSGQFGLSPGAGGRILQFSSSFYLEFVTANATLQWNVSNGPLWVMRASDDFCFNPQSSVGGNGAYLNISDRRAKTGIVPTTKGLAEIMQLQPVEFDRVNPATGTQHEIGFIAQDVQPIVPEAVWQAGIPMQDGSGGLDSGEPTLAMSESTITALNVNAIKELNATILALIDRVAALEAAP